MASLDGVFRREWGPAVAALARWSGDFAVAEDAVQEAFTEALRAWPRHGAPDNAGGWIVAVARNRAPTAGPAPRPTDTTHPARAGLVLVGVRGVLVAGGRSVGHPGGRLR